MQNRSGMGGGEGIIKKPLYIPLQSLDQRLLIWNPWLRTSRNLILYFRGLDPVRESTFANFCFLDNLIHAKYFSTRNNNTTEHAQHIFESKLWIVHYSLPGNWAHLDVNKCL